MIEHIDKTLKQQVLTIVNQIPFGKLMYYSQIASLVGTTARITGFILTGFTQEEMSNYPWQRVVNKQGQISALKLGPKGLLQIELLRKEGLIVEDGQIVNFQENLFSPTESGTSNIEPLL